MVCHTTLCRLLNAGMRRQIRRPEQRWSTALDKLYLRVRGSGSMLSRLDRHKTPCKPARRLYRTNEVDMHNSQKMEDLLYLKPSITNPVPGMTLCAGIPSSAMSRLSAHVYLPIPSNTVFRNIASTTTYVKTRIALSNFTSTQKSCHKSLIFMRSNASRMQGGLRLI